MYLSASVEGDHPEVRRVHRGVASERDDMAVTLWINPSCRLYLSDAEAEQLAADLLAAVAARREVVPAP